MFRAIAAALLLSMSACAGTEVPDECADPPGFAEDVRPVIVQPKCSQCHSESLMGGLRNGAPEGLNFDRLDQFADRKNEFVEAITSGREPPPTLDPPIEMTALERDLADRWRFCGFLP